MKKAPFTISYRFLKLLATHIFGDSPVIALRELIQNAHDAVLMRAATEKQPNMVGWGVRIDIDPDEKTLTILDTGIGMSPEDITTSLTKLGAGEKTEDKLKELKNIENPEMLKNVAGVFGFGFIAAMIVSKRIELWTKTKSEKPTYCYFDEGEQEGFYEEKFDPDKTPDIGTCVVLHLNPEHAEIRDDILPATKGGTLLDVQTVQKIVEKYCDLLEFEIMLSTMGELAQVANQRQAPWERSRKPSTKDMLDYFRRRFGTGLNEPLDYIFFNFTKKENDCEANGVLYVPKPSLESLENEGNLDIFVKRIWVCDDDLGLLPDWAFFLKGVIVSPDLVVAIDRKHLDTRDVGYHKIAVAIRDKLETYFLELASRRPQDFQDFLDLHGDSFRAGLLQARMEYEGARPGWFLRLARILPFRVYSKNRPGGYQASLNELLGIEPTVSLRPQPNGNKHHLYGINRIVPPNQQTGLRQVLADKTYPIIVPESKIDLYYLGAIAEEFKDQLQIENVEARFPSLFGQELSGEERDRWQVFVDFIANLLKYPGSDSPTGKVVAYRLPQSKMPILLHWDEQKGTEQGASKGIQPRQVTVINASSELKQDILKYIEERKFQRIGYDTTPSYCLHSCYHLALLDTNSVMKGEVFDDILKTCIQTMKLLLSREREVEGVKATQDNLQKELSETIEKTRRLEAKSADKSVIQGILVPDEPERRICAIVAVDLVGSSEKLVGMDFGDRGIVFDRYVKEMMALLAEEDSKGFLDKFTGDGVLALFGVEGNEEGQALCARAIKFAQKAATVTSSFGDVEDIRTRLEDLVAPGRAALGLFVCRIAISYGVVSFGRFGGTGTAVGKAVVEVARICSDKKLYKDKESSIVITEDVYGVLGVPGGFHEIKKDYIPRGLNRKITLYKTGI